MDRRSACVLKPRRNWTRRGGQKEYDGRVFVLGQTDSQFPKLQQDLAKDDHQ
jgi:hypothetical protein